MIKNYLENIAFNNPEDGKLILPLYFSIHAMYSEYKKLGGNRSFSLFYTIMKE